MDILRERRNYILGIRLTGGEPLLYSKLNSLLSNLEGFDIVINTSLLSLPRIDRTLLKKIFRIFISFHSIDETTKTKINNIREITRILSPERLTLGTLITTSFLKNWQHYLDIITHLQIKRWVLLGNIRKLKFSSLEKNSLEKILSSLNKNKLEINLSGFLRMCDFRGSLVNDLYSGGNINLYGRVIISSSGDIGIGYYPRTYIGNISQIKNINQFDSLMRDKRLLKIFNIESSMSNSCKMCKYQFKCRPHFNCGVC